MIRVLMAGLLAFGLSSAAWAQGMTPVGVWKSIDDETGRERSIIRITETAGELQGVVEMVFDQPGDDPAHLCDKCKGDLKDKPIIGMTILWGLKRDGDVWSGGEILDPKKGKVYRCKMTPIEGGSKLDVRGYIGISLIGRTQTWHRIE